MAKVRSYKDRHGVRHDNSFWTVSSVTINPLEGLAVAHLQSFSSTGAFESGYDPLDVKSYRIQDQAGTGSPPTPFSNLWARHKNNGEALDDLIYEFANNEDAFFDQSSDVSLTPGNAQVSVKKRAQNRRNLDRSP